MNYKAFISYSHSDQRIVKRLHSRLENYVPPKSIRAELDQNDNNWQLKPIFLDREELSASAELSTIILQALDNSEALIVVCSPAASKSVWVNREIEYFRQSYPDRPVFAFVVSGDPSQNPLSNPDQAAFPLSLIIEDPTCPSGPQIDPLAADARQDADGFKFASLKLIAGLLELRFDQLRQRDLTRQLKRSAFISSCAVALSIGFGVVAWQAVEARKEAELARAQAEIELTTERQTREFLLSVFQLADPSEARGNKVTVREILDRAVDRISRAEFSSSLIKAKLLSTMAQAYSSLGINHRSLELFAQSSELLNQDKSSLDTRTQLVKNFVSVADVSFSMGDYDESLKNIEVVNGDTSLIEATKVYEQVRLLNIKGDVSSYMEHDQVAEDSYTKAIELLDVYRLSANQDASQRSRSLGGLALLAHFQGDSSKSEQLFQQASQLLSQNFGEDHPDSIWASSSLASAAYLNNNIDFARSTWESLLIVATKVLGKSHPEIATIRNSLGLLALERGQFENARLQLEEAINIDRVMRTERFDDLVYPLTNLALLEIFAGKFEKAESLLAEAETIVIESNHRWRGPVSNLQADLACLNSDFDRGAVLAEKAMNDIAEEFGDDDWRLQQAKLTLWFCQSSLDKTVTADDVEKAVSVIVTRWGIPVIYTQRAVEQALVIFKKQQDDNRLKQHKQYQLGWM